MHILHIFCGDLDPTQTETPVIQHTVWIKNRALPKTNTCYKDHCAPIHTPPSTVHSRHLGLQGQWFSYIARSLPWDKSPCHMVMKQQHWHTVRNLLDSFSSLFIFSQVRATQKCVNDSLGVTVFLCKITKVFSLSRADTNLPTISYQDPSALASSDLFQQWASFKPSLDRNCPGRKGLQCWQLCLGLGSCQLNQDHHHISRSYPKST